MELITSTARAATTFCIAMQKTTSYLAKPATINCMADRGATGFSAEMVTTNDGVAPETTICTGTPEKIF
jgi:hypothetical protein